MQLAQRSPNPENYQYNVSLFPVLVLSLVELFTFHFPLFFSHEYTNVFLVFFLLSWFLNLETSLNFFKIQNFGKVIVDSGFVRGSHAAGSPVTQPRKLSVQRNIISCFSLVSC